METTIRDDVWSITALLSTLGDWLTAGLIDEPNAGRLRREYEGRLARLRAPQAPTGPPVQASAVAAPAPVARARSEPRFDLQAWAARRQADILLYLGAFLLVVSALALVSSQRETLGTAWRVGLLAGYTIGFLATGLLVRRWPNVREAGPVLLAIGALFTPLNFVLLYTEVLADRGVTASFVAFAGSTYSVAFYGVLLWRGFGRLYAAPAAIALLVAWGSLFFLVELPGEWFGAWWMAFAVPLPAALWWRRVRGVRGLVPSLVLASLALLVSHGVALSADELQTGPLPVTYALLTAGVALSGYQRRIATTLLAVTAGTVATVIATLWAFGVGADWYPYPALLAAALAVGTRRFWAHWSPAVSHGGWVMAAVGALAPIVVVEVFDEHALGAVAFAFGAAVLAVAAWRDVDDGALAEHWRERSVTSIWERVLAGWAAYGMLLVAIAYTQRELGVWRPDTGWSYTAVVGLTAAVLALAARRNPRSLLVLVPPFAAALLVSLQPWDRYGGHNAILLALPALELLLAFAVCRRWSLTVGTAGLAIVSGAALVHAADRELWVLALACAGAGIVLFAALSPIRDYRVLTVPLPNERGYSTLLLSWGVLGAALITAAIALALRATPGFHAPSTVEYRVLVALVMLVATVLSIEGWRLHRWETEVPALAVAGGALAGAWPAFAFPWWTLAVAYGALGVAPFLALASRRRYAIDRVPMSILLLSWAGPVAATLTTARAIALRLESAPGVAAVQLVEYRVLIGAVLLFAPALAFEARRLHARDLYLVASAVGVVVIELSIAIAEPSNVQAYTVPVAIYLAAVGLIIRRSAVLIEPHLQWHELVMVVGAGMLVLPQAQQGFEPGGAGWALVLLAEGALFLAFAFAFAARWLAVSGVLTLSGVAIRALYMSRDTVPYWLMLGVAGLILLVGGVTLLLQREWWDRSRDRVSDWWSRQTAVATAPAGVNVLALLSTLVPAALVIALA